MDARAGEGVYSWMQEQGWGHTPGCKSRGVGILLDARAGEGAYSWMQEQGRGILLEQEQEWGKKRGDIIGDTGQIFLTQVADIGKSNQTDEDIYLIELFSCSKTLLFSLGRCMNPEYSS